MNVKPKKGTDFEFNNGTIDIILWTCLHLYYNLQRPHVGGQSLFNTNL